MIWMNKDKNVFWGILIEGIILFLLWIIFMNIISKNLSVINIIKIMIIELLFEKNNLDIIIISLRVLMVSGAEILSAININHQKVMFGIIDIRPLNIRIFRVWCFIYKSFTKRNKVDDDNPWAIIIITASVNPV